MTPAVHHGASPETWAAWVELGLQDDLLPVVSDPAATISPNSKMKDLGKTPSRYNRDDHAVGIPSWTGHHASDSDIARWSRDSRLGVCVQTRTVRAIDVDIADPAAAQAVVDLVELGVGVLPRRSRANSGKCLLAFRMPGDFVKRVLRTADGIIEFLADGQQFIATGRHPSGARYEWDGGLAGGQDSPDEIPTLSPEEFEGVWTALASAFALSVEVARRGVLPSVPRNATQTHSDPMVAWLRENAWVREWDRDGRVHIRCPWDAEHTATGDESAPSSTTYFPAGVGGFAQGHFRCLHAHCTGRNDGDFLAAVGYDAAQFDVVEVPAEGESGDSEFGDVAVDTPWPAFTRDRQGRIEATRNNAYGALARPDIAGYRLGGDAFKDQRMIAAEGSAAWRPFTDADYTRLGMALESRGFKGPPDTLIKGVTSLVCEENAFDSALQWGEGLQWDGVERVERFLIDYLGAADTPYVRAVGRYLWSALGGRCVSPGCQVDMVPVFISGQGTGKTSTVRAMAPLESAFAEINLEGKDDDLSRQLRGKLVGEIAELRGLQSRDAESIKAWITRQAEEWIPKYREFATVFRRRIVFVGTGNNEEFLNDDTGERRWLPVHVGRGDAAAVVRDRDQLWAEGVAIFRRAGVAWETAQTLATDEHPKFKVADAWSDVVSAYLGLDAMDGVDGPVRGDMLFSTEMVLTGALRMNVKEIAHKDEKRVARVLRGLGYESGNARVDGKVVKRWKRVEKSTFAEFSEFA